MKTPVLLRRFLPCLVLGLLVPLAAPSASAAPKWMTRNDHVEITGIVTAPAGTALGGLQVTLELIRETRNLRSLDFAKNQRDLTLVTTTTDSTGAFRLTSPWSRYYNRMVLIVGLPVQGAGEMRVEELERIDLTPRLKRGGAAVVPIVVKNSAFVDEYRAFVATVASADEHRAFAERGRPDKVERVRIGTRLESAWWYFAVGQVCRFVDGSLVEIERFDPILPIQPTAPLSAVPSP